MNGFEWIKVWGPEAQKAFAARRAAGLPPLCIATRTADGARCGLPDAHAGRCEPRVEEPATPPPSPYEEAVAAALRAVQNAIAAARQCGRDGHADSLTVAEGFVERVLRHTRNPDA